MNAKMYTKVGTLSENAAGCSYWKWNAQMSPNRSAVSTSIDSNPGRTQPELRIPALQLKREWSPGPEFGWIPANLCDLSKG